MLKSSLRSSSVAIAAGNRWLVLIAIGNKAVVRSITGLTADGRHATDPAIRAFLADEANPDAKTRGPIKLLSLFRRKAAPPPPPSRHIPVGERVYAIGDIHGRDDLFEELVASIVADNAARPVARTTLILLGDLVDRGPASRAVVERAMQLGEPFDRVRLLIGNHEECFLAALSGDVQRMRFFVRIGGDTTLRSYMCDDAVYDRASFEELAEIARTYVPQAHVDYLAGGEDYIEIGDYVFVHAGLRAGVPLHRQAPSDLRWIREEFLREKDDFGAMVVYGHTISEVVDEQPNRVGIDTGAYATGRLTAIGLEGDARWFLNTGKA